MPILRIDLIVGARPNFIKMASVIHAFHKLDHLTKSSSYRLIHTGQHYDKNMSDVFFDQLNIPNPDINLMAGGGTQAEQTATIMTEYEKILMREKPNICLVVGDVNSTMACAITARKMQVPVAHIEGGLRSNDLSMPEEINRIVTDSISNYFFTTSRTANKNLQKSGIGKDHIFFVGNTMIDTLMINKSKFFAPKLWDENNLKTKQYILLTLHRPSNVDDGSKFREIVRNIVYHSQGLPIVFPMHPRTFAKSSNHLDSSVNLKIVEPLSYLEFNYLTENALIVVTDSGGITEEATALGVPCMTIRDNTERPETVQNGTNELVGSDFSKIGAGFHQLLDGNWKQGTLPEKWDGKSGERIIKILMKKIKNEIL